MRYDALQATLQKRFSNGLQGQIAYTYSKCMTDSIGYFGSGGQAATAWPYWQNLYDKRAEWGPCYYDVTHILASSAVYELPIGRTRKWGKNLHPVVDAMIADWRFGAIVQLHGGFPLTILANDASGTNSRGSRANCVAPLTFSGESRLSIRRTANSWAFSGSMLPRMGQPRQGTFGTCGVGTVRGPGFSTDDLSIQKEFPLSELKRLEFRVEFFNVMNTPILNSPNTFLSARLGLIDRSQGERNIQFALKFNY